MAYEHRIVQALDDLYNKHKDKMIESIGEAASKDFTMRAIWMGVKRQAPGFIQGKVTEALLLLDNNEEAIVEIEAKLREVLGIKELSEEELVAKQSGESFVIEVKPEPTESLSVEKITEAETAEVKAPQKRRRRRKAKPEPTAKAVVIIEPEEVPPEAEE